jgi:filamentous hemagglutinin family protein
MSLSNASKDLSETFAVAGHKATLNFNTSEFKAAVASRINGRAKTLIYGTITAGGYKTGGIPCNLTTISSPGIFPRGNYRVIMQSNSVASHYAVYNHSTKKLLVYSALGTEVTNGTNISTLSFPFIAAGE